MKILFEHNDAGRYGADRCLLRMAARLVRDGHEVHVVVPRHGPLLDMMKVAGIQTVVYERLPIISRPAFRSWRGRLDLLARIPASTLFFIRLMRRFRPDIVHTNVSVLFSAALAAKILRLPHVWHIRETYVEFKRIWPLYARVMRVMSHSILAVSASVADQFRGMPGAEKVTVLHDGFPVGEFSNVAPERVSAFRSHYELGDYPTVGIVGRIKFVRKGQEIFVQAAARLREDHPDVRYLVIGSPFPGNEEHLDDLQKLIKETGMQDRITMTGDVEDIKAAYLALDVAVLCSMLPEPLAGVVIESMALGCPVVATRIGGCAELVEDGRTGLLVPPGDPAALAEALDTLLRDEPRRQKMGKAGQDRFLQLFELEPIYKQLLEIYTSATNREDRDHAGRS